MLRHAADARPLASLTASASLEPAVAGRATSNATGADATGANAAARPPAPYPLAPLDSPPPRPAGPARSYAGPLQLDLDRIVLPHRAENVPPPPEFIFTPFVSSRTRPVLAAVPPPTIDPRPCRVVDEREACRRIERGWRVDVAPCVNVGALAEAARRQSRRRGGRIACAALPAEEVAVAPLELEAASA